MYAMTTTPQSLADLIDQFGGRVACLSTSKDPNAKVTLLLFQAQATSPSYVAKVPTTDLATARIEAEAAHLVEISHRGLGDLNNTVPEFVTMAEHENRPVLVTTALPGRSMIAGYHTWHHTARRSAVAADFAAAAAWLGDLHANTADDKIELAGMLDGVADKIERKFTDKAGVAADVLYLHILQRRMTGYWTPRTVVHGDFWPGNLLFAHGRVSGVVDWEAACAYGSPLQDVAHFVISYSLYLDRHTRPGRVVAGHPSLTAGHWGCGVEYAVDGSGWYPLLVRRFLANALQRLGTAESCWRDVLLADLATTAAEADHPDFAWQHLQLFRRMYQAGHR